MCSIMGYCGSGKDRAAFQQGFGATVSRGPDASQVIETKQGLLGFHRLAIMDLTSNGMQPFQNGENYAVCNGEIFNFRNLREELAADYTFQTESDCEVLLPLYKKYGISMFNKLDAEFAMVLFDGEEGHYVAARDPIGIRPLYYGWDDEDTVIFASEAKNLVGLCHEIYPFPPGHYYLDGEFHCYCDITKVHGITVDSLDKVCDSIRDKLIAGVEKRLVADANVGFLLSGGLDSSLVCSIAARKSDKPIRTFAIGMEEDAIDLKYAREVAEYLGTDHTEVFMTKEQVLETLDPLIGMLGTYDITTIRASMGMYLLCKWIHENTDIKVLLTGEISDELFGYKYTDFAPSAEEFQKESIKRVKELHMYDVLRADRCISVNSLEARVPFGDLSFVSYVMSIDPEMKRNHYGKGKYLLRHAFDVMEQNLESAYLPASILWREKAAFSDAVGHSMADDLKEYAASVYADLTEEEFQARCAKYTHATPFTAESLLYREIFEKYYPGQSHMVTDFWMPNKTWPGCDVDDPSARVLSNYGDSGK